MSYGNHSVAVSPGKLETARRDRSRDRGPRSGALVAAQGFAGKSAPPPATPLSVLGALVTLGACPCADKKTGGVVLREQLVSAAPALRLWRDMALTLIPQTALIKSAVMDRRVPLASMAVWFARLEEGGMSGQSWRAPARLASLAVLGALVLLCGTPAAADFSTVAVDSFHWPPGAFLSFRTLKQTQKERLLNEVEARLDGFRQAGKSLFIKGELMTKASPEVPEFNPATVLDQSGMVVIVKSFPNIYYRMNAPETTVRRTTAFVLKNPRVDRVESILRQAVVLRGDFLGFSQAFIQSTVDSLQKALTAPTSPDQSAAPQKLKATIKK